ncbi:MAG TPA: phosphopentomutase [Bacilli bacterium]|nr:MAG: Phosphopentomutase [Tenericutes bacterium ADurb.BinA124]HPN60694.1 phosphopentomutase [Bacilli bacterium]HPX84580.1 phosphopentomutase [Bacilli bacterium]HQC74422.1 phosphopentomutase [Bacilli bacterium]
MTKFKRIFLIVIDSVGVGAQEDAEKYHDLNTNTLKHLSYAKPDFAIPTLQKMGIGNITDVNNTPPTKHALASYGKMREISVGKDTLTGHWELMGIHVTKSFPSYTEKGFPKALIDELEKQTNHEFIGNIAASGTEIIKELGEQHLQTGALILYTSADSVLQIAANEDKIPLLELYRVCEIARRITLENPDWMVGRIIARPFIGSTPLTFTRTSNRHDYAVKPFQKTVLDALKQAKFDVLAVGKINDIFDGEGITHAIKTKSNAHGMEETLTLAQKQFLGLCFVNLVDFDAQFGHRRDAYGYAKAVEEFDFYLNKLLPFLNDDDLLMICADHGNDPTHIGTDHTREFVPILVYNRLLPGINLGIRQTFADVGATIAENFVVPKPKIGTSFLKEVLNIDGE